jgi:hypothetical protein
VEALTTLAGLFILLLIVGYALGGWDMLRSAIKPKPEDYLHWNDRALRVVGVMIFLAIFVYAIIAIER